MTTDREQFEAWFNEKQSTQYRWSFCYSKEYAWEAWQAARAAPAQPCAHYTVELRGRRKFCLDCKTELTQPAGEQSCEQRARDMLERIGVENAQSFTAGDLVELANLINSKAQPADKTALERFNELKVAQDESDPVEQLRAFCSLAMSGQDWLDVEPFFDAIKAQPAGERVLLVRHRDKLGGWRQSCVDEPDTDSQAVEYAWATIDQIVKL